MLNLLINNLYYFKRNLIVDLYFILSLILHVLNPLKQNLK